LRKRTGNADDDNPLRCGICHGKGHILTKAGDAMLAFLKRWTRTITVAGERLTAAQQIVLQDAAHPDGGVCAPRRGQGRLFRDLDRRGLLSVEFYDGTRPIYRLTLHGWIVADTAEAYRREREGK
jgi:hypothetical protein